MNRRTFLRNSLLAGAAASIPSALTAQAQRTSPRAAPPAASAGTPSIIDTNVNLFQWPFRRLKYSDTGALVTKLRGHRVAQAWAGSFEALFHKDMDGVNARLAEECRRNGGGMLVPFGSVNPAWPDWEEDLRRCHEVYRMPGVRLYAGYQTFSFSEPEFARLLQLAGERGLIVQIAMGMEDSRVHHPIVHVRRSDLRALVQAIKQAPDTKVQLLYAAGDAVSPPLRTALITETHALFDISRFEGNGVLGRLLGNDSDDGEGRLPLERMLFGSHAPYFPVETAVIKLFESFLTLEQMQAIMEGNARRLLPG